MSQEGITEGERELAPSPRVKKITFLGKNDSQKDDPPVVL